MRRLLLLTTLMVVIILVPGGLSLWARDPVPVRQTGIAESECADDASHDEQIVGCYAELRRYLNLTDDQLRKLAAVQQRHDEAEQSTYDQVSQKRAAVAELLERGSSDAHRIGELLIEAQRLEQRLREVNPHRGLALNELTREQQGKLGVLTNALRLQSVAGEAAALNLVDDPGLQSSYGWFE